MVSTDDIYVRFWGVRGTLACGGNEVAKYGGNTSCIEIKCGPHVLIFDAGTGLRYLADDLAKRSVDRVDLFLTHWHYDHVCGLPFFAPLFSPRTTCRIWGAGFDSGLSTEAIVKQLMQAPLLPIGPDIFSAKIVYKDIVPGERLSPFPDVDIGTVSLNHPNGALGFRVTYAGRSICYVTDTEHFDDAPDPSLQDFIRDSDIVIYDSMYTEQEYEFCRGFGHSTWRAGLELCDSANVGQFVAFHHDPSHDDTVLDAIRGQIRAVNPRAEVAREGLTLRP